MHRIIGSMRKRIGVLLLDATRVRLLAASTRGAHRFESNHINNPAVETFLQVIGFLFCGGHSFCGCACVCCVSITRRVFVPKRVANRTNAGSRASPFDHDINGVYYYYILYVLGARELRAVYNSTIAIIIPHDRAQSNEQPLHIMNTCFRVRGDVARRRQKRYARTRMV